VYREPVDVAGKTLEAFLFQRTCCSGPTRKIQETTPSKPTTVVRANAKKKFPVRSINRPAIAGPRMPAKFPTKFCSPVQPPDASGPASVWVIVQVCELVRPNPTPANNNKIKAV